MDIKFKFLSGQKIKVTVTDGDYAASAYCRFWGAWLLKCRLRRKVRILKRAIRAVKAVD